MKKIIINVLLVVAAVFVIVLVVGVYKFNFTNDDIYIAQEDAVSAKDATYTIGGERVTLRDGYATQKSAVGASATVTTRYFGNEAVGDLNNDGKDDIVFLLTQQNGGTATLYFAAVALASGDGYEGINAVLLGDRIAPQSTRIVNGVAEVNYVDRKPSEPFTTKPSVGVSKLFVVRDNQLIEKK